MLTIDQVQKAYATTSIGVDQKRMQFTEYIQCELLDSLFKQEEAKLLSFIGGTCLRIAYGGNRFSEDLDFDNFGLSFEDFKTLLGEVVRDMSFKGFEVEFRFVEKQAFHCHVKFPSILYENGLTPLANEKILVRIDTLQKEKHATPTTFLLNRFDIYRNIFVNPAPVLMAQKLVAILERKTAKGRDFYDVSFLYGFAKPDFDFLEKTTGVGRKEFTKNILNRCAELDFKALARDVSPFLIVPDQIARVETFPAFITARFAEDGLL